VRKNLSCTVPLVLSLAVCCALCYGTSKVKIRGYVTARPDADTLMILDDKICVSASTRFELENSSAAKNLTLAELAPVVEHYGRSSSASWSNHDSNLLRGSFLSIQLTRQYPKGQFDHAIVNTNSFKDMKMAMGPVKSS